MRVVAPWTPEQVAALTRHQYHGELHPYTCPGERPGASGGMPDICPDQILLATPEGWVCACGQYKQYWAHAGHAKP